MYSEFNGKRISEKVLERFIKDQGLKHIRMTQEPYFSYQVELFDLIHDTKAKIQLLYDALSLFKNEQEFLEHYNTLKDTVINDIKGNPAYGRFISEDFNKYAVKSEYSKHDVFNMSNIYKTFASFDLKRANFQAFKFFDPMLVQNAETYEYFIRQYTEIPYFVRSKYMRQVIFGNLNTGRQTTIERFLTYNIVKELEEQTCAPIRMFSDDEVVIEAEGLLQEGLENFVKEMKKRYNLDIDLEMYVLKPLGKSKEYFVKEFINKGGVEFMNVKGIDMPQVVKFYYGLPLDTDMDLVFEHENRLAHFDGPIEL